jgi:tetraacyldisaccharide 4'-kinase
MKAPRFWNASGLLGFLLAPLGLVYDLAVRLRFVFTKSRRVAKPVICVGNFTLGGAGKTPAVIYIAERLKQWGETPFILTRGYGGRIRGPHRVELESDQAEDVGDEALLLARVAPTIIGGDRSASAEMAILLGASVLVLDDGMQNPALKKNLNLALIDAQSGFGNRLVFPAGPLRGALSWQKQIADTVVMIDAGARHASLNNFNHSNVMSAHLQPQNSDWLKGARVLAFCGIGNPEKFRTTLRQLGATIVHFEAYPDHYIYHARDATHLIERAACDNLTLVTTEKDHVRLQDYSETRAQLAGLANIVAIKFTPTDTGKFDSLLKAALLPEDGA